MEWKIVQDRLNEIIQVDVMADTEWDFMATHMPFKNLPVQYSGRQGDSIIQMSEEDIYQQIIFNPNNEHRMIIVRGPNGAGKSHLIRWFRARMQSDSQINLENEEKVVFIRRIDNTLRGTMRQLLEQNVVSDSAQREKMQKFIQSSVVQSESELKSTIYYTFLTKIETEDQETEYRSAERKRLATFLRDDIVKDYLMAETGPISRFYELIAKPHGVAEQVEAAFKPSDFIDMKNIRVEIQRNGNQDVKLVLGRVLMEKEAAKFSNYLNQFSRVVIQQCANIAQGEVDEMIRQLRLDLKKENRNLTVLIEDMTTFTGMDAELIKVLSVPHTGTYSDLCRVTSVIGLTDAYYNSHFRGNFQNRVTHQITVDSSVFGDVATLAQMAVRYINAAYLSEAEVIAWYRQGANADGLPYKTWQPQFKWESEQVEGRTYSLFPFTRKAFTQLYSRLPEKTPRFFLRDVIKAQLLAWCTFQREVGLFPDIRTNAIGEQPIDFEDDQHAARFDGLSMPQDRKRLLRVLFCLWGEGHMREEIDGASRKIGNLPIEFFQLFGFNELTGVRQTNPTGPSDDTIKIDVPGSTTIGSERIDKNYRDQINALNNWYQNKAPLPFPEDFRSRVRQFLIDSINWQLEGVPAYLAGTKIITKNIYIEDQKERRDSGDRAIVTINRDADSYWMLTSLTHWHYKNKSWDFKNAPFMQYKVISWLEQNKIKIISSVKGEPDTSPNQTLQWSMALEYLRLGLTGGLAYTDKDDTLLKKLYIRGSQTGVARPDTGDPWSRLLKFIDHDSRKAIFEGNKDALIKLPNSVMGTVAATGRDSKFLFHRDKIDYVFTILKKNAWDAESSLPKKTIEREDISTSAAKLLQILIPRVKEVLEDERRVSHELINQLKSKLGESLERQTWVDISRKTSSFLNILNSEYRISFSSSLISKAEKIEEQSTELARICKRTAEVIQGEKFSNELTFFSSNPCKVMDEVLKTIEEIEELANKEGHKAEQEMANLKQAMGTNVETLNLAKAGLNSLIGRIQELGEG